MSNYPTLRENLLRDFGHDLPIAGGGGSSRTDPIIVTVADPEALAFVEMRVLDNLSRVRGIYWRSLSRCLLGSEWPGIEQYKYETARLTETEIITTRTNHYFGVSALPTAEWKPILASVSVGARRFPLELGWLHLGNHETTAWMLPDMVVPYRSREVEATLYVYRFGGPAPAGIGDPISVAHFEDAAAAILRSATDIEAWPDPPPDRRALWRYFMVGTKAERATLLGLTIADGYYVKMRATWTRDRFIDRVVNEWTDEVLRFVGRGPPPQ